MKAGPFDSRKKRARCKACCNSHLKCSGETVCSQCERRRLTCTYEVEQIRHSVILVDRGKQKTAADFSIFQVNATNTKDESNTILNKKQKKKHQLQKRTTAPPDTPTSTPTSSPCRLTDDRLCYLYYFDVFTCRNSFTGREHTLSSDVKMVSGSQSASHLMDAMMALGAVQAVKLNASDIPTRQGRGCLSQALEFYSKSILGLRNAINLLRLDQPEVRNAILWTTSLLGIFELINDVTGYGWQQHMIHGTAKALEASGPLSFRSGPSKRFLMQARVFEVARTILFNEPSLLTRPEWQDLFRVVWAKDEGCNWHPLDSLLDIMVMCSRLRVRTSSFIDDQEQTLDTIATITSIQLQEAQAITTTGFALREALLQWHLAYASSEPAAELNTPSQTSEVSSPASSTHRTSSSITDEDHEDGSMLLARIFFAAISIYLSGIYDWEISHWQRLGLATPTLDEQTAQMHNSNILRLTATALDRTSISPLLLLFPLRISGARSRRQWQRDCICTMLDQISVSFSAAHAIKEDLSQVWQMISLDEE